MKFEFLEMTVNVFFFLNAQLILWYCNVSFWLENGQTADFVPLIAFCIASSRLPVLEQIH